MTSEAARAPPRLRAGLDKQTIMGISLFTLIKHLVSSQNQFASGGILLMLAGGAVAFLRSLPAYLWDFVVEQATMTVSVTNDDAAFQWVKEWFLEQQFLKRVRRVDLDTTLRGAMLALIPAPGRHLFWYQGRPFWVWFHRGEPAAASGRSGSQRRVETLTFQTLGRRQAVLRHFVDEVVALHRSKQRVSSSLYIYDDCYWECVEAYSPRLLESIVLKPGDKERLVEDLTRFRAARKRYRALGVPYHRGYLLFGPPGTGKTSLVSGLAATFGMSIYMLNLTELNDRSLKSAINNVPENSVILFEDIDAMRAGQKRVEAAADGDKKAAEKTEVAGQTVTLSGLLNVLDGFHAPENVVFIMTTNHAEALDPALLRPGRIDYKLFMGEAGETQKVALYRRFFTDASESEAIEFSRAHQAKTMAEFQGMLLRLEVEVARPEEAVEAVLEAVSH